MNIAFLKTNNAITLHYDGKTKVIAKEDPRFERVLNAFQTGQQDSIPEIIEPELYFKSKGLDLVDGLVMVKGEAMPAELNQRIAAYQAEGLPFKSLLLFWENLKKNPSFNSRQQLFKFLENKGHSITEDGCFIGYRGVRDDFKDKHSGSFDNSPGSICEMPREQVDDNPDHTCSHGLHVGGYEYAKDFGSNGKLVMVKVNPADVVAVPNDYNGQKMRVCRFEVLKETADFLQKHVVGADGSEDVALSDDFDSDEYDPYTCENCGCEEPDGDGLCADCDQAMLDQIMEKAIEDRKKAQYANNHAKRGPDGRFVPKKKTTKTTKKSAKRRK